MRINVQRGIMFGNSVKCNEGMSTLGCQHFYSLKKPERMMKQKQMDSL
jgi:hypothetical protein